MSAVVAGMTRDVAEVIDEFLRPLPFGVELYKLTGHRVMHVRNEFLVACSAEAAHTIWETYADVNVTVEQYILIDGVKSYSNEREAGVKWAGEPFPPYSRFTRRWRGRATTVDAEFTVGVCVPAERLWEHNRWLAAGGLAAIRAPDPPETPAEHVAAQLTGEAVAAGIRFMAVLRR